MIEPSNAGPQGDRGLVQSIIALQLVVIVGLVWVLLQFGDLPGRVAEQVPPGPDPAGEIFQLQQSVDALSAKLDAIEAKLSPGVTPAP
jgi:hypothetical protein